MPSANAPSSSAGRDGDGLERAEHVGEPEPDETDVPLLERAQHEFFLPIHGYHLRRFSHRSPAAVADCRRLPPEVGNVPAVIPPAHVSARLRSGDRRAAADAPRTAVTPWVLRVPAAAPATARGHGPAAARRRPRGARRRAEAGRRGAVRAGPWPVAAVVAGSLGAEHREPLIERVEPGAASRRLGDAVGVEEQLVVRLEGEGLAAPELSPRVSRPSGGAGAGTSRTVTPSVGDQDGRRVAAVEQDDSRPALGVDLGEQRGDELLMLAPAAGEPRVQPAGQLGAGCAPRARPRGTCRGRRRRPRPRPAPCRARRRLSAGCRAVSSSTSYRSPPTFASAAAAR